MNQEFELQPQIDMLAKKVDGLIKNPQLLDHLHNGFDVSRVNFSDIYQRKVWVQHTITGSPAVHQDNFGTFYIIPFPCLLNKFQEAHDTTGTDAGAVTVTLEKLTS